MNIRDVEIDCDGCNKTIDMTDRCYCEDCIDKRDDDITDLEKKIESLYGQIAELKDEISSLQNVINSA